MISGRFDNAVPFALPATFLLTGAFALGLAMTTLALKPQLLLGYFAAPPLLAVVHLLTLGFATLIFAGAMHQLAPVIFITSLHSLKLGSLTYALLALGSTGVVLGFTFSYYVPLLAAGGLLVLAGMLVFLYNLLRTVLRAPKCDAAGHALIAASFYLTLTVTLGLLIALGRVLPGITQLLGYATPLHLGLGLFGTFFLAIAGAGHKLLGMFVLAHGVGQRRVGAILALMHGALLTLLIGTLWRLPLGTIGALLLAVAVGLFLYDVLAILKGRMRKSLERAMWHYLLGIAFLPLSLLLWLFGAYPAAVYGFLGGFITLAIAGMLVKIVSFLSWQHHYARKVGLEDVPMLKDMLRPELERLTFLCLGLGALGITFTLIWPALPLAGYSTALSALGAWGLIAHLLWIVVVDHQTCRAPAAAAPLLKGQA